MLRKTEWSLWFSLAYCVIWAAILIGTFNAAEKLPCVILITFAYYAERFLQETLLSPPTYHIPLFGLQASGKTALLCRLCKETSVPPFHTMHPCTFGFCFSNESGRAMKIESSDTGGASWFLAWEYMRHGMIFLVDASNRTALDEAREKLKYIVDQGIGSRPILVLGNKSDVPGSAKASEIKSALNLQRLRNKGGVVSWDQIRLVLLGGCTGNMECPLSWIGDDVLHLILEYTGPVRRQERIISDPFMCSNFSREGRGVESSVINNDELVEGLSWLMIQLQTKNISSSAKESVHHNFWRNCRLVRVARILFWRPEKPWYRPRYCARKLDEPTAARYVFVMLIVLMLIIHAIYKKK